MQEAVESSLSAAAARPRRTEADAEAAREFGGTFGAAFIMSLSHALMLYLWIASRISLQWDLSLVSQPGCRRSAAFHGSVSSRDDLRAVWRVHDRRHAHGQRRGLVRLFRSQSEWERRTDERQLPQLPWGTLEKPRYLDTEEGSKLLVDGWWRCARKIHYTGDILMALSWGLICGFDHFLPYRFISYVF